MKISKDNEYRTRGGHEVRIYAMDCGGDYPIHGSVKIDGEWVSGEWSEDGRYFPDRKTNHDLIEVKPRIKMEYWLNVYSEDSGVFGSFRRTKKEAEKEYTLSEIAELLMQSENLPASVLILEELLKDYDRQSNQQEEVKKLLKSGQQVIAYTGDYPHLAWYNKGWKHDNPQGKPVELKGVTEWFLLPKEANQPKGEVKNPKQGSLEVNKGKKNNCPYCTSPKYVALKVNKYCLKCGYVF